MRRWRAGPLNLVAIENNEKTALALLARSSTNAVDAARRVARHRHSLRDDCGCIFSHALRVWCINSDEYWYDAAAGIRSGRISIGRRRQRRASLSGVQRRSSRAWRAAGDRTAAKSELAA